MLKKIANCQFLELIFMELLIKKEEKLARYTSFKTGGSAFCYARVDNSNIEEALGFAKEQGLPTKILAGGFNTLVLDELEESLVLHFFAEKFVNIKEDYIYLKANTPLSFFLNEMMENSISGYEFLAGIPSSIGGAIAMNAGVLNPKRREISEFFISADVIDSKTMQISEYTYEDMLFGYRTSALQNSTKILLGAKFKRGGFENSNIIRAKMQHIKEFRAKSQPQDLRTAGSIFKGVDGKSAGFYIEQCELKGYRVGGAKISEKHANWIVNEGTAKSRDILDLMEIARGKVYENFGISLEAELKILS